MSLSISDFLYDMYSSMGETISISGQVTNPGANATICETVSALPSGLWKFECYAYYGGSGVAANEIDNFALKLGTTVKSKILAVTSANHASAKEPMTFMFRADGTVKASIASILAASAATVEYRAMLVANKVMS